MLEPSKLSLIGLIRHMADVERGWFRRCLAGQDAPPIYYSTSDPDGDFDGASDDPQVVADAWQAWRDEIAFAENFVAQAPRLEVTGRMRNGDEVSLRWVLTHMVEEYARHNGHADILREQIDGAVGQ